MEMRHRTPVRPRYHRSGERIFALPESYAFKRHELAVTIEFISHRALFGEVYSRLQPDYFYSMPNPSGVYVCPVVPTRIIASDAKYPGDIDLLIIPYERDELILHRVMAMEIKIIRASFANQSRSPNQMGISQATGLLQLGFPYVVVGHFIVSDTSPESAWRTCKVGRIVDEEGRLEDIEDRRIDMMPADLIDRSFGRLSARCNAAEIGLVSAFIASGGLFSLHERLDMWLPWCRKPILNSYIDSAMLQKIAAFFESRPRHFLDQPRFDPI